MSILPGRARPALFWAAMILAVALPVEGLFRLVFPLPEIASFNRVFFSELAPGRSGPQAELMNAAVLWTSEPDHAEVVLSLNLYGFRDRATWRVRPDPSHPRVMFLGDSFVEGVMAPDTRTLPVAFGAASPVPVEAMNLGIGGTGLGHYTRLAVTAVPLFRPSAIVLVLYANDLPPPPFDTRWLAPPPRPVAFKRYLPRVAHVLWRAARGRPVPRAWHTRPFPFFGPVPDVTNPLTGRAPGYEPLIEPALLDAMKRGRFNPYLSDHLARSHEALRAPVDVQAHLAALAWIARRQGATLHVAYLPHALQVSDYYMAFTRRYAVEKPVASLAGPEYQQHAAAVAETCRALDLPFLDLTPALRREEQVGRHLYWDFDNHMRPEGYELVGRQLAAWWAAGRPASAR